MEESDKEAAAASRSMKSSVMKRVIPLLICLSIGASCRNSAYDDSPLGVEEAIDSLQFPILIDEGTKIVYQVGRMTPDKGLKLYLDTVAYTKEDWELLDSLKRALSFPSSPVNDSGSPPR
jgi:hypothetical protein